MEVLSLLMFVWFLQFEQKSIRIVKTWKFLLKAIDDTDLVKKYLMENLIFCVVHCSPNHFFLSFLTC